jgi:hypothetical protein
VINQNDFLNYIVQRKIETQTALDNISNQLSFSAKEYFELDEYNKALSVIFEFECKSNRKWNV